MNMAGPGETSAPDANTDERLESDCVTASVEAYRDKLFFIADNNYFMVTRCFKDKSNDTLNKKCQHPRFDRLDETVPVTSLRTNHTYWNSHCAICNRDADDVVQWSTVVNLWPKFYYFTNSSETHHFPQTIEDLHLMLISTHVGLTYKPTADVETHVCLSKHELLSCSKYEDANTSNRKGSIVNECTQFYSPMTLSRFGLKNPYKNPFCFFCRNRRISPDRNTECDTRNQLKSSISTVTGLLDYRKTQDLEETAAGQDLREGNCRCTEVEDPYLGICRPAFCAPGDIWMKCRCAQPIKSLSGIAVRLILKLIPGPGRIDIAKPTQLRKLKIAMTRFLQNIVENTKVTVVTIFHFHLESDSSEYLLSLVTLRSNPGYDTKRTMKPLLKYLDKKSTQDINIDDTRYAIQFTTRVLVWKESVEGEGTKLMARDLDADGVYNISTYHTDVSSLNDVQPLSPLLYCKQIQLNAQEYTETDGQVNIKTSSPTFSLPYYYRIDPHEIRVCVSHYLKRPAYRRETNGSATNHVFMSITGLIMLSIVSFYGIA